MSLAVASYYNKNEVTPQKKSSCSGRLHLGDASSFQGDTINEFLKVPVLVCKVVWQNSQMSLKAYLIMNQRLNVIPCASAPFKLSTSSCFLHQREEVIHIWLVVNGSCAAAHSRCEMRALWSWLPCTLWATGFPRPWKSPVSHSRVLTEHLKLFCPEIWCSFSCIGQERMNLTTVKKATKSSGCVDKNTFPQMMRNTCPGAWVACTLMALSQVYHGDWSFPVWKWALITEEVPVGWGLGSDLLRETAIKGHIAIICLCLLHLSLGCMAHFKGFDLMVTFLGELLTSLWGCITSVCSCIICLIR